LATVRPQVRSRAYGRLFEPAVFENGLPNPRHLSNDEYLALARSAALRTGSLPRDGLGLGLPVRAVGPVHARIAGAVERGQTTTRSTTTVTGTRSA
jgi:hypothetical protein